MSVKLTNKSNVSITLAVMLANDNYQHDSRINSVSSTTILKPLRELALQRSGVPIVNELSINDLVASRTGSAVHTMLEEAWLNPNSRNKALNKLGLNDYKVLVNPKTVPDDWDGHLVYVEIRNERKVGEYILTGMYDIVEDGLLQDLKNTGTFKVEKTTKELPLFNELMLKLSDKPTYEDIESIRLKCPTVFDYSMQGSIYTFIDPDDVIKDDFMLVQFIMKDYKNMRYPTEHYPTTNPLAVEVMLFDDYETGTWVEGRLNKLDAVLADKTKLPVCSNSELWVEPTVWKVYAKEASKRCMNGGTFDSLREADAFQESKGGTPVIKEIKGEPKRCGYCSVKSICDQYNLIK
jgi:hypothetical protein